ncbi:MAG TPA: tetratricopeptide repeat protein, partial [Terriglobia bacterium]|nr:tetratricopeptide repeat protein [Terriglobia bacterium]
EGVKAIPAVLATTSGRSGERAGSALRSLLASVSRSSLVTQSLIVLAVFTLYSRSLISGFVYDDQKQILENPFVLNPRLWTHIFSSSVWSFNGTGYAANFYRPLMIFSFWLVDRISGPRPAFFHLFQLILFAATACAVYAVGKELLGMRLAAFFAAVLWAVHPERVEAAAWISALCDTGCGLFYVLAFWMFLRAERSPVRRLAKHGAAALAFFVALLFKEMAISLPVLLLAWWFFAGGREPWRARAARWTPYIVAAGTYLAVRRLALGHLVSAAHSSGSPSRVLVAAVALFGGHTQTFVYPVHLSAFRTFHVHQALHSPWPWLSFAALLMALLVRKKAPALSFLVFWWPLTLLPCLDIYRLSVPLLADRFTYIPAVGLCLAITLAAVQLLPAMTGMLQVWARDVAYVALAALALFWSAQSYAAIAHWRDNQTLLNYSLKQSPGDPSLHIVRAWELDYRNHDLAGAAAEFKTAMLLNRASLRPNSLVAYNAEIGLGRIALEQGQRKVAISRFLEAIQMSPRLSTAYQSLGAVYFPDGDYATAATYFRKAVRLNPFDVNAHFYLGSCWMKLGKYKDAAGEFHSARQVDPQYWQAYQAEALALEAAGETRQAAAVQQLLQKRRGVRTSVALSTNAK